MLLSLGKQPADCTATRSAGGIARERSTHFFQRPATGVKWTIVRQGYLTATTEERIPLIEVLPAETCGSSETSDNHLECGDMSPLCLSNTAILSIIVDKLRAIYFNFGCSQQKNRTSSPRPNDLKKKAVMNHRTPQVT